MLGCADKLCELKVDIRSSFEIEEMTVGQSSNPRWVEERRNRLTASHFGEVCCLRSKTKRTGIVKRILCPTNILTNHMKYGQNNEKIALGRFVETTGVQVK